MTLFPPFFNHRDTARKWLSALGAVLLCLASFLADNAVAAVFQPLHSRRWDGLAAVLNCVGDWPIHSTLALAVVGIAWMLRRKALARLLLTMILASTLAGAAVNVVRFTTGRPRPSTPVQDGFYGLRKGGQWIVGKHKYQSFPSAHTATATAFAGVALFAGLRYGWMIALFGPLVGCARIYSGAHHFSDVVTAVVIGLFLARWAWHFTERKWPPEPAITADHCTFP